jgi:hypothetical protein
MTHLLLTLYVADGISHDNLIDEVNAEILCRLEEDDKKITGWQWLAYNENNEEVEIIKNEP